MMIELRPGYEKFVTLKIVLVQFVVCLLYFSNRTPPGRTAYLHSAAQRVPVARAQHERRGGVRRGGGGGGALGVQAAREARAQLPVRAQGVQREQRAVHRFVFCQLARGIPHFHCQPANKGITSLERSKAWILDRVF